MESAYDKLYSLRQRIFRAIDFKIHEDPFFKKDEGAISITAYYSDRFSDDGTNMPKKFEVKLSQMVLGENKEFCWEGDTLYDVVDQAEKELNPIIEEIERKINYHENTN